MRCHDLSFLIPVLKSAFESSDPLLELGDYAHYIYECGEDRLAEMVVKRIGLEKIAEAGVLKRIVANKKKGTVKFHCTGKTSYVALKKITLEDVDVMKPRSGNSTVVLTNDCLVFYPGDGCELKGYNPSGDFRAIGGP